MRKKHTTKMAATDMSVSVRGRKRSLSPWLQVLNTQLKSMQEDTNNQQLCIQQLAAAVERITEGVRRRRQKCRKGDKEAGLARQKQLANEIDNLRMQLNTKEPSSEVAELERALTESFQYIKKQEAIIASLEADFGSCQAQRDMLQGMVTERDLRHMSDRKERCVSG